MGSTKLIGQLHWALFIVIQSGFCFGADANANVNLAITGTIKGSSRERLYQELGLESLSDRRWYRRLVYLFDIVSCNAPGYLCSLLPGKQRSYDPVRSNLFRNFTSHTNFFKNSFFPYCISEWNNLSPNIPNSNSISIF